MGRGPIRARGPSRCISETLPLSPPHHGSTRKSGEGPVGASPGFLSFSGQGVGAAAGPGRGLPAELESGCHGILGRGLEDPVPGPPARPALCPLTAMGSSPCLPSGARGAQGRLWRGEAWVGGSAGAGARLSSPHPESQVIRSLPQAPPPQLWPPSREQALGKESKGEGRPPSRATVT